MRGDRGHGMIPDGSEPGDGKARKGPISAVGHEDATRPPGDDEAVASEQLAASGRDVERPREEGRGPEIESAITDGTGMPLTQGRGADPENPSDRDRMLLTGRTGRPSGVSAESLFGKVSIRRSTYCYQANAL